MDSNENLLWNILKNWRKLYNQIDIFVPGNGFVDDIRSKLPF